MLLDTRITLYPDGNVATDFRQPSHYSHGQKPLGAKYMLDLKPNGV